MNNGPTSSSTAWHCSKAPEAAVGAEAIARFMLNNFPNIESVGDVGCSVGTFLKAFSEAGVESVSGFDAQWVDKTHLVIPEDCFQSVDLSLPLKRADTNFDLLICLEVAEHLPEDRAESFVADLTDLSDLILFSAAIPGQGGVGHVNEQWQSYWHAIFKSRGYTAYDIIRNYMWNDQNIPVWYRQNTILYSVKPLEFPPAGEIINMVHPEHYLGIHYRDMTPKRYLNNKLTRVLSRLGFSKEK